MLEDKTYRQWTDVFIRGSYFTGDWTKNSKMQFLSENEKGEVDGMTSVVADNIPYELVSIKHIGLVKSGVEDTTSSEAKKWVGYEKYRLFEVDGMTELRIEVDTTKDFESFMRETWPKSLKILKELTEKAI